jgi:hypothetical protein
MAASEPADDLQKWTNETDSSDKELHSRGFGMAGMSLVSSMPQLPPPGRKGTSSTISSSPPDYGDDDGGPHQTVFGKGSAPASPNSDMQSFTNASKCHTRPPGMSVSLPSPIRQPGHSKNSSASSPLLTLTPNSSVDGSNEWINLARQPSPYHGEAPTIPHLNPDHRRIHTDELTSNLSNLDISANDNDGLLGLDALRERSNSLPDPSFRGISSSPPLSRAHITPHLTSQHFETERPRSARDRPPLSQSFGEPSFLSSERSAGGMSNPFSNHSNRTGEVNNISMDSSDSRGLGAIGRSELRQSASEFDPNRRRASSQDNFLFLQHQGMPDPVSQKFGTLPTLSSLQMQQRRMSDSYADLQKPRHIRSISQPGFPNNTAQLPPGIDPRFYSGQPHSYSGDHTSFRASRGSSIGNPVLSQNYDGIQFSKSGASMPNLSGPGGYKSHTAYSSVQRRDGFDYHLSPGSHSTGSIMASSDDQYGSYGTLSPAQSPHELRYVGHIRQQSEGAAMLHTSGMPLGMGPAMRSHYGRHQGSDEDLTHPLVGEHIEVPDHEEPHPSDMPGTYFINQSGPHPVLRNPTHAHSMSLDAIPPQFYEATIHRQTAGAGLPIPKIVYTVKFKRSQRNFVLGPRISRDLKVGTYVKVEADRGEDLGIVVGKVSAERYGMSGRNSFTAGIGPPPTTIAGSGADLKRVIRLATHDEVSLLAMKREEEEELLRICRRKVRERGLPMNVVDAEYQFDRHKLTFFFEAEGRVDFRELVRDLFSMYKTRIWMQQLDKNTSTSAQAIVAPQTQNMQMDFGTPIIAPASEFADSIVMNGFDSRSH